MKTATLTYCSYVACEPDACCIAEDTLSAVLNQHLEFALEDDDSSAYPITIYAEDDNGRQRVAEIHCLLRAGHVGVLEVRETGGAAAIYQVSYVLDDAGKYLRTDVVRMN